MMFRRVGMFAVAAVAAVTIGAGDVRANELVNGGFDTGDFTGWTQVPDFLTNGKGWKVVLNHDGAFLPQAGSYFLRKDEDFTGHFYQTFNTVAGKTYDLSFYLARPQDNNDNFNVHVDVFSGINGIDGNGDGDLLDVTINDGDLTLIKQWVQFEHQFTATSNQTTLRFLEINTVAVDPFYDSISVTEALVPEPASLALVTLGGLMLMRRRRA